jgi:hypothetical protein
MILVRTRAEIDGLLSLTVCGLQDLVPTLARLFFMGRLPMTLSFLQSAVLLAAGLQCKSIDDIQSELELPANQVLAFFNKTIKKAATHLQSLEEREVKEAIRDQLPQAPAKNGKPGKRRPAEPQLNEVHTACARAPTALLTAAARTAAHGDAG